MKTKSAMALIVVGLTTYAMTVPTFSFHNESRNMLGKKLTIRSISYIASSELASGRTMRIRMIPPYAPGWVDCGYTPQTELNYTFTLPINHDDAAVFKFDANGFIQYPFINHNTSMVKPSIEITLRTARHDERDHNLINEWEVQLFGTIARVYYDEIRTATGCNLQIKGIPQ